MTSVANNLQFSVGTTTSTGVLTCTYGDAQKPIPYTYNKHTNELDFDFSGDFTSSTSVNNSDTMYARASTFNANRNILSIGPNIIAWMENQGGADIGSVRVQEYPIMVRANVLALGEEPNSVQGTDTFNYPISFEKSAGEPVNNYVSTFLYKKPLVLRYTTGGGSSTEYRVFATQWTFQT